MATGPRLVKDALAALFSADAAFTGVTIFTYTAKTDEITTRNYLVLGDVVGVDEPHTMAGGRLNTYTIECTSSVSQPLPDGTSDRAWELLSTVAGILATGWTVSGNVIDADIGTWEVSERVHPDGGRVADLEFTIEVRDQ